MPINVCSNGHITGYRHCSQCGADTDRQVPPYTARVPEPKVSMLKECSCEKPEFALVNGCFMFTVPPDAHKIRPFIGRFVCFHCGGVAKEVPENYCSVTATTIMRRLKELGLIKDSLPRRIASQFRAWRKAHREKVGRMR